MLSGAMPIYEYRRADGTTFELLQKFTDEALTVDPETGAPVQRVFHAPAIHFKGKGFHNTDYGTRKRNQEKAAQKSSETSSEKSSDSSSSSSSTSGDSKPASSSSTSSDSSSSSSSSSKKSD